MQVFYRSLKESTESRLKLWRASRDMVRLLQALVDLLDLKIINSKAIDLKNINAVMDGIPDWWKEDYDSVWQEDPVRLCKLYEDSKSQD